MWAASYTVQVDDWLVGVRVSRRDVADVVADMLASGLVDVEAQPNFSVRIGGFDGVDEDDGPLHLLYRARRVRTRSRRPSRILDALAAELSAFAERDLRGAPHRGLAVVGPTGRAAVLSPAFRSQSAHLQRRLEGHGVRLVDAPDARLDLVDAVLAVPEPVFRLDAGLAAELDGRHGAAAEGDAAVEPGDYPVAGWLIPGGGEELGRRSSAIAVMAETLEPPGADADAAQTLLDRCVQASRNVGFAEVSVTDRGAVIDAVVDLVGGRR